MPAQVRVHACRLRPQRRSARAELERANHGLRHDLPVLGQLGQVQLGILVLVHLRHQGELERVEDQFQVQVIGLRDQPQVTDGQGVRRGGEREHHKTRRRQTGQQDRQSGARGHAVSAACRPSANTDDADRDVVICRISCCSTGGSLRNCSNNASAVALMHEV